MKTILLKTSTDNLKGYQGVVFLPVGADCEDMPDGQVAATLSFSDKVIRSIKQNASIHKYCTMLALDFENRGLDMQAVLAKAVPVKWTMEAVKEVIWRRIQIAMFPDKTSTTRLETGDVNEVYQVVSRHLSTEFNITQPFPNRWHD